ncbi:MAG: hypothetical protein AAF840_18860 [Bacteroidota bacterium]
MENTIDASSPKPKPPRPFLAVVTLLLLFGIALTLIHGVFNTSGKDAVFATPDSRDTAGMVLHVFGGTVLAIFALFSTLLSRWRNELPGRPRKWLLIAVLTILIGLLVGVFGYAIPKINNGFY